MKKTGLILFTLLIAFTVSSFAQLTPKISDIKTNPDKFLNEIVTITGHVQQYIEDNAETTTVYYLRDDWGGSIKVRTDGAPPKVGLRYQVTGPVSKDSGAAYSDSYIFEKQRELLEDANAPGEEAGGTQEGSAVVPGETTTPADDDEAVPGQEESVIGGSIGDFTDENNEIEGASTEINGEEDDVTGKGSWFDTNRLALFLGVVFILLVAVLIYVINWYFSKQGSDDLNWPDEKNAQVVEGKTIKMQVPPPGTLKLLPGRFEVTSGEDTVKEIRFFRPKGQTKAEITFGRAKGPAYTHVQLKPMTVSSRQAKITFEGETFRLINYPGKESNPTRINDREMAVEESITLKPNDKISMGEIDFVYRAK